MSIFKDSKKAEEFLRSAGVFFEDDPEDEEFERFGRTLNMNDVWCWACADGEEVKEAEMCEVAELFWLYGWCGILYWVSEKNEGMKSEFLDNNRFIEFVRQEETLRKRVPDDNKRAYTKLKYTVGVE